MFRCSTCGGSHNRDGQRECAACHAATMRDYRQKVTRERRAMARVVAGQAKRSGTLSEIPCQVCGSLNSEMHHPDHEMPLLIVWLCPEHHRAWHGHWKRMVLDVFTDWLEMARACNAIRKREERALVRRHGEREDRPHA